MIDVVLVGEQLRRAVPGGIGTYIRGLSQGLRAAADPAVRVTVVAGGGSPAIDALGLTIRRVPLPSAILTRAWSAGLIGVSGDVVHAPSLVVPRRGRGPRVVVVHDLAWQAVPETFPEHGRRWHERSLVAAQRIATAFVVPAPGTAEALAAAGVRDHAIHVIGEGADHLAPPDDGAASEVLRRLGVDGPFLLTVSTLEPRKNLARLAAAYDLARRRLPEPWPLVVVGPNGWGPALAPSDGIVLAGQVSEPVLSSLYARARAVAYVPLVEGWGLPAVEAMWAGAPVVSSPMPSTAGAGLVVDPRSAPDIAEGLLAVALDTRERTAAIASGQERARSLRWSDVARAHVRLWEDVA